MNRRRTNDPSYRPLSVEMVDIIDELNALLEDVIEVEPPHSGPKSILAGQSF